MELGVSIQWTVVSTTQALKRQRGPRQHLCLEETTGSAPHPQLLCRGPDWLSARAEEKVEVAVVVPSA